MKQNKEQPKYEFMKGLPEISIVRIVRRSHSAQECPHGGNCLREDEMYKQLGTFLRGWIKEIKLTSNA